MLSTLVSMALASTVNATPVADINVTPVVNTATVAAIAKPTTVPVLSYKRRPQ